jgi:UDP-N-acetylglucosamine 1-carboxyvinyltransferase
MTTALHVTGPCQLDGEIHLFGSKKALPKVLIASMLTDERCCVKNVAWVDEVAVACDLLNGFGRRTRNHVPRRCLEIEGRCAPTRDPIDSLAVVAGRSRAPLVSLGPQLARFGEGWLPPLGGDRIGPRAVDWHIRLLQAFGVTVMRREGWLRATAEQLHGAMVTLPFPMVGVTEHALLVGALARGRTRLTNAAIDPEVEELADVLNEMGARIQIDSSHRTVAIEGVTELGGFEHRMQPDRLEAGSWASAALASGGDIFVRGISERSLGPLLWACRAVGGEATCASDGIRFTGTSTRSRSSIRIDVAPYPAFESDWQSPMLVALCRMADVAYVHETVFESRFEIVSSLRRAGAEIDLQVRCGWRKDPCRIGAIGHPHLAVIRGRPSMRPLMASMPDLRSGFALVIAAAVAAGESMLTDAEVLDRGYENVLGKLRGLGVAVDEVG